MVTKMIFKTSVCLIILQIGISYSDICTDSHLSSFIATRLDAEILERVSPIGFQQCQVRCRRRSGCSGINYNRQQLMCELMVVNGNSAVSLTNDIAFIYHDINFNGLAITQGVPDACQTSTCPEGYICSILHSGLYVCINDIHRTGTVGATVSTVSSTRTSENYTCYPEVFLCFRLFYETTLQWSNANTACTENNGRLIILDTVEKFEYMRVIVAGYREFGGWWIDGSCDNEIFQCQWSTGDNVFPVAMPGTSSQDRLTLTLSGFLSESGLVLLPYICEPAEQ